MTKMDMKGKSRAIGKDEVQIVHDLAHRIWPHAFKDILTPAQIEYMLDMMYSMESLSKQINAGHQFFVWEENEKPVAYIGIEQNYPKAGKLRIHKIYVLPEMQGTGLGTQLIHLAESIAIESKCTTLHLNVNRFNKAVAFYQHIGFQIIKTEDIDIGNGYLMEDYVMEWKF